MCSSTFRVNSTGYTPLGLIFRGDRRPGDGGQWELLQVRDTTSNTLDSIGYTPLGYRGRGTADRGQWELLQVRDTTSNTLDTTGYRGQGTVGTTRDTTSNTLDSVGYTLDISFYWYCSHSQPTGAPTRAAPSTLTQQEDALGQTLDQSPLPASNVLHQPFAQTLECNDGPDGHGSFTYTPIMLHIYIYYTYIMYYIILYFILLYNYITVNYIILYYR